MRILVLGSTGMLGHIVLKILAQEKNWDVIEAADFKVGEDIHALGEYDYIINCIGMLSPITDVEQAIRVNVLFPHELARTMKGKIVHMSTDGVFSGKSGPYTEDSPHDCTDIYGKTKSLGEVNARNVINIRTSIIGPSPLFKKGFLEWFLAQPDGVTIQGFSNHIWHGVTTLQFAQLCANIIKQNAFDNLRNESGIFHFTPNNTVTKYELLELFKKVFVKNVLIKSMENPRDAVERVLQTKYAGLKKLFPHGVAMESAVKQLAQLIRHS